MLRHYLYKSFIAMNMLFATVSAFGGEKNLTTSEIRTLKNAAAVLNYLPQMALISRNCDAQVLQEMPVLVSSEESVQSLEPLFLEKIKMTPMQLRQMLDQNQHFAELAQPETVNTPACEEREALVDFAEQYSNNFTALELSEPLSQWQHVFATPDKTFAMDPTKLNALLAASHSQVMVEIKPKQLLTPLQQANFLHIDDKSSYIFEVQQGWKTIAPRYLGLHIHLEPQNYLKQPKHWLLLLDANFHAKAALSGAQMKQALQQLGTADWSFNRQGDLLRSQK